jgi:hypothetical protein
MQQPVPQHLPSFVPQQHFVCEGSDRTAPSRGDCTESGVETAARLVLIASTTTVNARIGVAFRLIVLLE